MAVIFLSILTLGIYDLFWLVKVKKELNDKTSIHTPSLWLLFAPLIAMFVLLIVMLTVRGSGTATSESATATMNITVLIVDLVAILAIVPITFYWFFKFSKAVGQYTGGAVNTAVAFLLLYLLRFIGIAVIQDHFNDMLEGNAAPGPQAATASYPQAAVAGPSDSSPQSGVTGPQMINPAPVQPLASPAPTEAVPDPNVPQNPGPPTPPPVNPIS